jgi:8-oxo-dGTP pyrophosphatase MutT (NUDIX family)
MADPVIPQLASTVVLLRPDQDHGFEIYLNRRPENMETYAGVYVFPGGRVEQSDWSTAVISRTRGVSPVEAQEKLGAGGQPEVCLGHWVAAVRELFEEVGIHFFVSQGGPPTDFSRQPIGARIAAKRAALQRGQIDFADLLSSEQLFCDLTRITYFFHRITPDHYRARFDTRFYLATLPPDQSPTDALEEVAESLWISPGVALDRYNAGEFPMTPPTLMVLRTLNSHPTWSALRAGFNLR